MNKTDIAALAAAQVIEDFCNARNKCEGCLFHRGGDCVLRQIDPPSLWFVEDLVEEGGVYD